MYPIKPSGITGLAHSDPICSSKAVAERLTKPRTALIPEHALEPNTGAARRGMVFSETPNVEVSRLRGISRRSARL